MLIPVVLSGGGGSRLWPLSREQYPKQLLPLVGEQTMIQQTVSRVAGVAGIAPAIIVCNEDHRFMVAEQLRSLHPSPAAIILEPCGRNTAPAVAIACLHAQRDTADDPLLLILPADHLIADVPAFQQAVSAAAAQAQAGKLVTFGIVPTSPETGYGYIRGDAAEGQHLAGEGLSVLPVVEFVEKPDLETARNYVDNGNYFWNSGMFMFRAGRFLEELEQYCPEMYEACVAAYDGVTSDLDFTRLPHDLFSRCPADSIDYAVMEKTDSAVVVPLSVGWNDIGSWSALWDVGPADDEGNVIAGDVLQIASRNNYLHATTRLLAVAGVEDLVVVETADAVLVTTRNQAQQVKTVVDALKLQKRQEPLLHRRVNRPWGAYEGVDQGEGFQVKRITVHPGASLSLQMHHHRAEHWVVVKGTARVICGEKTLLLHANQSTYIPLGETHRLENPGLIPLEMIEVQSGEYLGEDDIVRFDDVYGR